MRLLAAVAVLIVVRMICIPLLVREVVINVTLAATLRVDLRRPAHLVLYVQRGRYARATRL
jgi:hypothetical protein